jgi:hypothetical protein
MDKELPDLDVNTLSTHEFVARSMLPRFPGSTLKIDENPRGITFDIYFKEKLIVSLNKTGVRYFFPTRRKKAITWEKVTTSGLPRVIEYILRDMAQADYVVLSTTNKQILKRPIHISRYTRCPECKDGGGVRIIFRGESLTPENSELYTPISRSEETNWAEIKCILCGWIGSRVELMRKIRKPHKP